MTPEVASAAVAGAAVDVSASIADAGAVAGAGADDPSLGLLMLAEHGPSLLIAGVFLLVLWRLLVREQTARDAATKDLVDTLRLQPAAIAKLETAITGLSAELSGLRRSHDSLVRGHDELRERVDHHATRLDDHDRRLRAHEYSEPAATAPPARSPKHRPTPAESTSGGRL